jgi:glycine/sarcosine N-methyltransferase
MGFYEQISKYYDYIFPTGKDQVNFIKETAGQPPKKILDVACGSGGYSMELAKSGYAVTGIDLDAEMVNKAKEKAVNQGLNITILK